MGGYMNKRILTMLGNILLPVGVILFSACGPQNDMNQPEIVLDQASDNWIGWDNGLWDGDFGNGLWDDGFSEWGHCHDAWDNDGNGFVDMADPNCHILGPIRDLSLFDFPIGHNFDPNLAVDLPLGPGYGGEFRDREQITRWLRFLTEPDGNTAGITLLAPGVNPEVVPIPAPLPAPILQGTAHQGNNNNVNLRGLHEVYLDHGFIGGGVAVAAGDDPYSLAAAEFVPDYYDIAVGIPGGWPGEFYRAQGPWGGWGSQGALYPARTGNPDFD